MKFCREDIERLIELKKTRGITLDGDILKVIEDGDDPDFKIYIEECLLIDRERRRKRLEITKQIQLQNTELLEKSEENKKLMEELQNSFDESVKDKEEIEKQNSELLNWREEHEKLSKDLQNALLQAEKSKSDAIKAKENAENDLDILQKRTQFELMGVIVKISLGIILGVGIITSIMYIISLYLGKETQTIGTAWSNLFGILLTNAFSIIGTIMGMKYATGDNSKNNH